MKKIYIVESQLKKILLEELLKNNNTDYLANIELISPKLFLKKYIIEPEKAIQFKILKSLDLKLFKANQESLAFLNEILEIRQDLDYYNVDLNTLRIEDELKAILNSLKKYDLTKLEEFLKLNDYSEFIICEGSYSFFEAKIFKHMLENKAKKYLFKTYDKHESFVIRADNERLEMESLVQYIINNDLKLEEIAICLANPLNAHLLISTLKRYNIPYNYKNDLIDIATRRFLALLNFKLEPSLKNYLKVLDLNIFSKNAYALLAYLDQHFPKDVKYDTFLKPLDAVSKCSSIAEDLKIADFKKHLIQEEKANKINQKYYPILKELIEIEDFKELVIFIYNLIAKNSDIKNLRYFLQENAELLTYENSDILIARLKKIKQKKNENNGLLVLDGLKAAYKKYLFIIDTSDKFYPAFKVKKGLVSERILKDSNYPSLEERVNHYQNNLSFIDKSYLTIFFCPKSDFTGKDILLANDLEQYPIMPFELVQENYYLKNQKKINKDSIKKIFLDENDILHGSISGFEDYMACNYRYFLSRGLKLYSSNNYALDALNLGNIVHAIFERLIKDKKDAYYSVDEEDIESILKPYFVIYNNYYPSLLNDNEAEAIYQNFKKIILGQLKFLNINKEYNEDFKPTKVEEAFSSNHYENIHLRGFIDRIDESNNAFRIIDYKTSEHILSKKEIIKGLNLQLLTYLIIYADIIDKEPEGAYYLNIYNSGELLKHGYKLSEGFNKSSLDNKAFNNHKKLYGISNKSKDEKKALSSLFRYMQIKNNEKINLLDLDEGLKIIYAKIYHDIKEGKIDINPVKDACTYCTYKDICLKQNNKVYEREDIIEDLI